MSSETQGTKPNDLKLLDIGCGTGNYINQIKDKVGMCYGLEFNQGMLEQATAKHKEDERVVLKQGSVLELGNHFPDETFDIVIMT